MTRRNIRQGTLDVGDAPPPSLVEDDELDLRDLATVAYVERATWAPGDPVLTGKHLPGPTMRYCKADDYCSGTRELTDQGMFGPRGDRFHRYWCPECGASMPESARRIVLR